MPRPGGDDREAIDRAFADLIAGYHLTSDRPDPLTPEKAVEPAPTRTDGEPPDSGWADSHPLFSYPSPPAGNEEPASEERFVPEPPRPLPRPGWPVLVAWIGMGYAVLAVLAAALGLHLPAWTGWLALLGFVGGFTVLVTRLPRHRPPDAGDGAVL